MFRLLTLISALWPFRTPGTRAGMRGASVPTIHVFKVFCRAIGCPAQQPLSPETNPPLDRYRRPALGRLLTLSLTLLILALPMASMAATPVGTVIDNTASATFNNDANVASNLVRLTTVVQRTPSTITFLQYAPTEPPGSATIAIPATEFSQNADLLNPGSFSPVGAYNDAYQLPTTIPVVEAQIFHGGQPLIISLEDQDQNLDPTIAEQVLVEISSPETGDREVLLLTEDGTDSGVFYGYLLTNSSGSTAIDGRLAVVVDGTITARYIDQEDGEDVSTDAALIDPYGYLFDSITGDPINGAQVSLYDVTDDQPATVYDDFGQPGYPSTVTTGDIALGLPAGGFRFPLIEPGKEYRLDVQPPAGYSTPSVVQPDILLSRFGDQYVIDATASYGGTFFINPGPAVHIDIPADPSTANLWLLKEAERDTVAIGDFLLYRLTLENQDSDQAAASMTFEDRLPRGFRYQEGSLQTDGRSAPDPDISPDGRTLRFSVGDLPAGATLEIAYVVEVAAGTPLGEAVNQAQVFGLAGTTSNLARASVTVRDDFFRDRSFIMGRVMVGSCEEEESVKGGLANVRIYLEDGTYVISDEEGKYHFEGVEPGLHVVQLDLDTLPASYEILACEENSQFSGRAFSQFVELQGGTLWRADFHVGLKPAPRGEVSIALEGDLDNDEATFSIPMEVGDIPLKNLRLSVILPQGLDYLAGQSTLDGQPTTDPDARGPVLTYRLGDRPAGWNNSIALKARVNREASGELPTKAILTFNSPTQKNLRTPMAENLLLVNREESRTPMTRFDVRPNYPTFVAELSTPDKLFFDQLAEQLKAFEITRLYAIGHTDNVRIAPRSRNIHADNMALSVARATNVARYLGEALKLPPADIVITGRADTEPAYSNAAADGRSLNRRVEIRLEGEKVDSSQVLDLVKAHSGPQSVEAIGKHDLSMETERPSAIVDVPGMPVYDAAWLASVKPEVAWLWPPKNHVPQIPSIKAAVQHLPGQKATLALNGIPVDPIDYEGRVKNAAGTLVVSTWRGIAIKPGDNTLELTVSDADGKVIERMERIVHDSFKPVSAVFVPEESLLIADGRTVPVIAVRLSDQDRYPATPGISGPYSITAPYLALQPDKELIENGLAPQNTKYHVGADGLARILLEPTTQSGEVVVNLPLNDGPHEIRAWLKPSMRDWILVGFAQGTLGYNTLDGNMASLKEAGLEDDTYTDGRVKFFAKGAIKGEWLLTMAYDSDKKNQDGETLHQQIDPDTYYPLYGDSTQQGYEASSADNLYVKLERDQFYALYGDFETGLSVTELSRYSRNLNGFKTGWRSEHLEITAFASETKQAFFKDEIRGDGTSGLYHLTGDPIVTNSEQIVIETRGRLHDEVIVNIETLARHTDYEIDYDDGTLFFKKPIPSRDADFNPVYIVARYETVASDDAQLNYGGRAAVKLMDDKVEIGASYIHEEAGTDEGDLIGVDATIKITENTTLRLEAAQTDTEEAGVDADGDAYLAELEHRSVDLDARVYYRQQDENFGLNQQSVSEGGTRKVGAEADYRINDQVEVGGQMYRQDNLATDAIRDVAETDISYGRDNWRVKAGYREARDEFESGEEERSSQVLVGAGVTTMDGKLTLHADHEQSLGDQDENSDFPTRTVFGADYKISERLTLFAEQEYTWGKKRRTEGTRAGFSILPWTGGTFTTSMERQTNEDGSRVAALLGLQQKWQITERWSLDASLDRNQTLRDSDGATFDSDATSATSGEDFTSVSVGSNFRGETWSWDNRIEVRDAETDRRWGVSTALITETKPGVAYSSKAQVFLTTAEDGNDSLNGDVRFGLVFRPTDSRWILLDRFDFYFDQDDGSNDQESWRLVNNLNANYKPNRKFQVALQYGVKYVREKINGQSYDGVTDLVGTELRYNFTKRWDAGLHASLLHSWNSNQFDYSAGVSIGYAAMKNTWVSIGYNLFGFEDEDFSAAHYTAQGPFIRFRVKFDQQTVREAAEWMNR